MVGKITTETYHKLFVPEILILAQLATWRSCPSLARNFQPFLQEPELKDIYNSPFSGIPRKVFNTLTSKQLLWTYLIEPRHLQGEMSMLDGSMLGSWQIRHTGIDMVDDDWDRHVSASPGSIILWFDVVRKWSMWW